MKVTYIYHSCYALDFDDCCVMIDFYKDAPDGWVKNHLSSLKKPLYVLCTHSHADHFNKEVITWKESVANIHYIFSEELLQSKQTHIDDAVYLKKTETYSDERITIQAFGSTDIGGSFLIKKEGKNIFHAGDLNNWHWNEEVSKAEALSYENNYLCELELLAENVEHLYLAMFPVDPRLGKDYMCGAKQFVSRIGTDYFLSMHFGEQYDKANAFQPFAAEHKCKFLTLSHQGQSFQLSME